MSDFINNSTAREAGAEDADFDHLLRSALRARPEPSAPHNLADQAMQLARSHEKVQLQQRARRLARQRRWGQITSIAAALLIGTMLAVAVHRLWVRGDVAAVASSITYDASSSDTTASASSTSAASTSTDNSASGSTISSGSAIALVVAAELAVLGIIVLVFSSRAGLPTQWSMEAVAGLW